MFPVHDALKGGPERHLGFAEADVSAEQAFHGDRLFHIGFDGIDRLLLIIGQPIREFLLKLPLQFIVRTKSIAPLLGPCPIKGDEPVGQFIDPILDLLFLPFPFLARKAGKFGGRPFPPGVFPD